MSVVPMFRAPPLPSLSCIVLKKNGAEEEGGTGDITFC